jgi:DNA-binding IclR family transcriptional regulator
MMHQPFSFATLIFETRIAFDEARLYWLAPEWTALIKRHSEILDILSRRGYLAIEELVAAFNVTPQTLRRDLQDLVGSRPARRHHGGASANLSTANADYGLRHVETAD